MKKLLSEQVCRSLQLLFNFFQLVIIPSKIILTSILLVLKSKNGFGSIIIKSFYGNGVSLKVQFSSKSYWKFDFFMIAWEIIKRGSLMLSGNAREKLLSEFVSEVPGFYLSEIIIYLWAIASKFSLSIKLFCACRKRPSYSLLGKLQLKPGCT